jgi:seryl-tRNA synthetase
MQFWKEKLTGIYTEQAQNIIKLGKQKEDNKKELDKLEEEEIKLMEEINKYHSQGVEKKKEYLAALSLPVKEVADAMEQNHNASGLARRQSMTINHSRMSDPR